MYYLFEKQLLINFPNIPIEADTPIIAGGNVMNKPNAVTIPLTVKKLSPITLNIFGVLSKYDLPNGKPTFKVSPTANDLLKVPKSLSN